MIKVIKPERPKPPIDFGLYDKNGVTQCSHETIEYIILMEIYANELEEAPCWSN